MRNLENVGPGIGHNGPQKLEVFIKQLHQLRLGASNLGMHRVVICLDYAYWEAISEQRPPDPLDG